MAGRVDAGFCGFGSAGEVTSEEGAGKEWRGVGEVEGEGGG
ncbi:MAG: hypothetical protein ACK5MT_09500 [Actinomycetales bacterium]